MLGRIFGVWSEKCPLYVSMDHTHCKKEMLIKVAFKNLCTVPEMQGCQQAGHGYNLPEKVQTLHLYWILL